MRSKGRQLKPNVKMYELYDIVDDNIIYGNNIFYKIINDNKINYD